jgi:ureidoacrylate peracid hydrolase
MLKHKIDLNPDVVARVMRRRGAMNAYTTVETRKTALLAIDVQNWTMDPSQPTVVRTGESIVDPINRVADTLRARGGMVVWIKQVARDTDLSEWSVFYDSIVANQRAMFVQAMRGVPGEIYPAMNVKPQDWISEKTRYSCVLNQSSDLHRRLQSASVDTVIIAGTVTNVCCESSARDAMMMNYRTIVLSDGCAAHTDAEHNASLSNLLNMFADVRPSEEVVQLLEAGAGKARAVA